MWWKIGFMVIATVAALFFMGWGRVSTNLHLANSEGREPDE
jgi:hypothetical protein